MPKKTRTLRDEDELIPTRPYEYMLQRFRLVHTNKTAVLRVVDVRDEPDSIGLDELPSIQVTMRILGFKLFNPVTGRPMLPDNWFRSYFESWPVQKGFLEALAVLIAERIPEDSPEFGLKAKFKTASKGRASKLPPRADLRLIYQKLIRQLNLVRKWLHDQTQGKRGFTEQDKKRLLDQAPKDSYWWLYLVEQNEIALSQISSCTAEDTALLILTRRYGSQEDAIKSRLFRPEQ
jgi:hypothetical protein